jgi:hypothetical protein
MRAMGLGYREIAAACSNSAVPAESTFAKSDQNKVADQGALATRNGHFVEGCRVQSVGAAIGLIPARSARLIRIVTTAMTSPSNMIPADTTYPRENP